MNEWINQQLTPEFLNGRHFFLRKYHEYKKNFIERNNIWQLKKNELKINNTD